MSILSKIKSFFSTEYNNILNDVEAIKAKLLVFIEKEKNKIKDKEAQIKTLRLQIELHSTAINKAYGVAYSLTPPTTVPVIVNPPVEIVDTRPGSAYLASLPPASIVNSGFKFDTITDIAAPSLPIAGETNTPPVPVTIS